MPFPGKRGVKTPWTPPPESAPAIEVAHRTLSVPHWTLTFSYIHVQLSICLNDMHHVRTVVKQLPQKLKLESFYSWLDSEEAGLGKTARDMVDRVLESADEDYDNKIRQIVDDTAKKVCACDRHVMCM